MLQPTRIHVIVCVFLGFAKESDSLRLGENVPLPAYCSAKFLYIVNPTF
jgi:hypothetical protein